MSNVPQTRKSFAFFDFSRGLHTKGPDVMIPINAMPYAKNVLWDEKNRISKVFGTTALIATSTDNDFADNPLYNLYNYIELDGSEVLIIQGYARGGAAMSLWRLRVTDTLGAPTDITPTGVTLGVYRRCNFATYKGLLWMTNGVNELMCSDGNSTATWRKWHTQQLEKFQYIIAHSYRLWMGRSPQNPIRVIYTDVNGDHFGPYYGDENAEAGSQNWMDFPTSDGTPITGLAVYQNSLIVFKPRHIFRVFGDPAYGVTISCISEGVGCVAPDSIAVRGNATVYFMAKDGVYLLGESGLIVSQEDLKTQAAPGVVRLTSEIDDYWASYVTPPNPFSRRTLVKSGATDFGNFTLTSCSVRTSTVLTWRPSVLTFNLSGSGAEEIEYDSTTHDVAVELTSIGTGGTYDPNIYYAQTATATKLGISRGIPKEIDLYLSNNGTLTSSQKLNVYITGTKTNEEGTTIPDLSLVYAAGQMSDCSVITAGGWKTITMSYWDYPQGLLTGASAPVLAVVVKPVGDTAALWVRWWSDNDGWAMGRMVNSDLNNPSNQATYDYAFRINCENWVNEAIVVTDAFNASADSSFVHWDEVFIELDEKTTNGYARKTELIKLEYSLSTNGTDWDAYVECNSWRDIASTKKYIKFRLTFRRPSSNNPDECDSFTLISIKATYVTQAVATTLVKGIVWDDRYILTMNITDSGG